jgi:hypothetical protein
MGTHKIPASLTEIDRFSSQVILHYKHELQAEFFICFNFLSHRNALNVALRILIFLVLILYVMISILRPVCLVTLTETFHTFLISFIEMM